MRSWVAAVRETDPVAIAVVQMTPSHPVFGQVAALFEDYRAHYGQPPSPPLARDWLVRRTHANLTVADTDLFPGYWNQATQLAAFGALNVIAAPTDYATLPDSALRLLAALPGNEAAFARITIHPFDMADPEIQDQRRPDDAAGYTPSATLRAYMDILPGQADNRYF
jgi:hypothetical protein